MRQPCGPEVGFDIGAAHTIALSQKHALKERTLFAGDHRERAEQPSADGRHRAEQRRRMWQRRRGPQPNACRFARPMTSARPLIARSGPVRSTPHHRGLSAEHDRHPCGQNGAHGRAGCGAGADSHPHRRREATRAAVSDRFDPRATRQVGQRRRIALHASPVHSADRDTCCESACDQDEPGRHPSRLCRNIASHARKRERRAPHRHDRAAPQCR